MIENNLQHRHKRVIPMPKKVSFNNELIHLGNDWCIGKSEGYEGIARKWSGRFGLSSESRPKAIELVQDTHMGEEEYRIEIGTGGVRISGSSQKGFEYAFQTLWQLSPDGEIPTGRIEDKPSLKMRGFHINFDSFRQMDIDEALYTIKTASELKLNTVLLEYSNRFPFEKHKSIAVNTTLTREDIKRINNTAKELGISIIPLQQSIAHLEYLLKNQKYASLRENGQSPAQVCPLNPDSIKVVKELLDEVIELHPGIKYLHVGGDEARSLGECPACREKVQKHGVSRLYIDYINSVCDWVASKGVTPIIWDDMVCAHPEALDLLDRRIALLYWDYWTVSKSSPYFVARYDRKGGPAIPYDMRWDSEWKSELNDLEASIMSDFCKSAPLEAYLGESFMDRYGQWLGGDFPKRIKGYPYLDFYRDKGFKVIGGPTSLGNGDNYQSLPNYWRFIPNIRAVCERCIESGAEGVITTAWYNYHPSMFHLGLGATAQFSWGVDNG